MLAGARLKSVEGESWGLSPIPWVSRRATGIGADSATIIFLRRLSSIGGGRASGRVNGGEEQRPAQLMLIGRQREQATASGTC